MLPILYPAFTLSCRCVGYGTVSSHHQRELRGKWYSGAGFCSATAGNGGRACWAGWGLGEFIDYSSLVWEGGLSQKSLQESDRGNLSGSEFWNDNVRAMKNGRARDRGTEALPSDWDCGVNTFHTQVSEAIFNTGNKLWSLFMVPAIIWRNFVRKWEWESQSQTRLEATSTVSTVLKQPFGRIQPRVEKKGGGY